MMCKFFFHNWSHVRIILEAKGLNSCDAIREEAAANFIHGLHGTKNPHQAIYVPGPNGPTGIRLRVLFESDNKVCPWTCFEVEFPEESCFESQQDFANSNPGQRRREKKARLAQEKSDSRMRADPSDDQDLPTSRGFDTAPNTGRVKRCGRSSWTIIALHTHNDAAYGTVAKEALRMYKYAFATQVDIICGDGNKHMQFHSPKHYKARKAQLGDSCSDIPNGLFNLLARGCVAQQNRNMPFSRRVNFHTLDSNIFSDDPVPKDVDCMFCQVFEWGKSATCQAARKKIEETIVSTASQYKSDFSSIDQVLKEKADICVMKTFSFSPSIRSPPILYWHLQILKSESASEFSILSDPISS